MTESSTKAADIVGVYDEDFNQLFPDARPLRASVVSEALFFKHPLESSATRTDHVVFQPVTISIPMVMAGEDYKSVYQQVKNVFESQTPLIVQTKVDTYENIFIQAIPHEESVENFDAVIMNLALAETELAATTVTTVTLPQSAVASPGDGSTKKRGQQQSADPSAAEEKKGSTLSRWFK